MRSTSLAVLVDLGVKLVRLKQRKVAALYFRIITPAVLYLSKPYKPL